MKKLLLLSLMLFFLFGCAQQDSTVTRSQFETQTEASGLEIARDWKLLSVMALIVSVILVAIAYMIGIGMEMPEIKAWANNELSQIIANAIIIASLIGVIVFIDVLANGIVLSSGLNIPECGDVTQSCLQGVTTEYLRSYVDAAREGARSTLMNNVNAAAMANRRIGMYCLTIYCLQMGTTTTIAGHYILDMDMYAIIFEYYTNLLASMEAQLFFINEISFNLGPVLLAIGIVGRSFFFTRKLGGLLVAVAIGIMFFLPGMYLFDWITLDTALAGDRGLAAQESLCPDECRMGFPLAYVEGTGEKLDSLQKVYAAFSSEDADIASSIVSGNIQSATGSGGTADGENVVSCFHGDYQNCPQICRELPYPSTIAMCTNASTGVQQACAQVPVECKVIRYVTVQNDLEAGKCPSSCKVVPPLRNNCDVDNCLDSSFDCRQTTYEDLSWRPAKNTPDAAKRASCNMAADCPASLDATESCVYVLPETGNCNDLCSGCPAWCRMDGADIANLPDSCKENGELLDACTNVCPDSCKVNITSIQNLPGELCTACPDEKRILASTLPNSYTNGTCSQDECPLDIYHRVAIPRNACETCLFTEESYAYNPPINLRCSDLCAPTDATPVKEPGSYMNIGADGLVGRPEIAGVAKLMIPAYLLPLFNIVATLIFIKGLSGILGGDIDIPGISKVF
ncbi:hypothetical protein JXA56_05285 [Candidatus Micrarchaeota archaeon]|nr:hypothetical protein [Candidatus Micrarchaeota archaeon]